MTRKQIERKLWALEIDMAGESTNAEFVAMCERFDELHEMLDEYCHGNHRDTGRGVCADCGDFLDVEWLP